MFKLFIKLFITGYSLVILLLFIAAIALIFFSVVELWDGLNPGAEKDVRERFNAVLESIGLLTIAVVALELAQQSWKRSAALLAAWGSVHQVK